MAVDLKKYDPTHTGGWPYMLLNIINAVDSSIADRIPDINYVQQQLQTVIDSLEPSNKAEQSLSIEYDREEYEYDVIFTLTFPNRNIYRIHVGSNFYHIDKPFVYDEKPYITFHKEVDGSINQDKDFIKNLILETEAKIIAQKDRERKEKLEAEKREYEIHKKRLERLELERKAMDFYNKHKDNPLLK